MQTNQDKANAGASRTRKRLLGTLAGVVIVAGAGWGLWWQVEGARWVSTDNAYTAAEVATVTPAVAGIVKSVPVIDTQAVHTGDVLVVLDDTDARLALDQADADLARASRRVRAYFANDVSLAAQVAVADAERARSEAQLQQAEANLRRAKIDYDRRRALAASGSVSAEELTSTENAFVVAKAALAEAQAAIEEAKAHRTSAEGSRDSNAAQIIGTTLEDNPEVLFARARREQALVDLERTVIHAPVDGVVARRAVQLGQRIQPGMTLMSVVPVAALHVDANFKEGQLAKVKLGQPVELTSDLYGSAVVYHGKVVGFSGGSGAVFAAIPAQNATGNWIKVVQRLPVRIALNPRELAAHQLQIGLSMNASIDTAAGEAR